jgi:hypothetical protein
MRLTKTKLLSGLWLISAVCLLAYVARKQSEFEGISANNAFDFHAAQHQNHILFWKPWVIIPYIILVGSALIFLLGGERSGVEPRFRRLAVLAILVSLVTYGYLLVFVR